MYIGGWLHDFLGGLLVFVAATTILFAVFHWFFHVWCFIEIAKIGYNEGRVGSVQTFNSGEGPGRIAMCVVLGLAYSAFIVFFLGVIVVFISFKDFAPRWMWIVDAPLDANQLLSIFVVFFVIYAIPSVIAAVTTTLVFIHDRWKMSSLKKDRQAAVAGGLEGGNGNASAPVSYHWDKTVVLCVPVYMEPLSNLLSTISAIADSDYPPDKIQVLVGFDDDSTKTLTMMHTIERILSGGEIRGYDRADDSSNSSNVSGSGSGPGAGDSGLYMMGSGDLGDRETYPPSYDTLPAADGRNKYNGLLKIANYARSSVDVRQSPVSRPQSLDYSNVEHDPRTIETSYRSINYTISRFEHGGKLHTQAKMFAMIQDRVESGQYPRDSLILFVDSDTTLVPSTIRKFVDHFEAEYIYMQLSMRFTEASFGSVTCMPGALTMIKYETMAELAKLYFHQADVDSTFEFCRRKLGEDRFLTHLAMEYLGPFAIGFVPDAVSKTEAPGNAYDLLRQRRRWLLGSLTNEVYMITTPSFVLKFPALIALRILNIFRLGGTLFYLLALEYIIVGILYPDDFIASDVIYVIGIPLLIWIFLAVWALWQRRYKTLFFFFLYILLNQFMELGYYGYALWTLRERTWGGPRAAGEEEEEGEEGAADGDAAAAAATDGGASALGSTAPNSGFVRRITVPMLVAIAAATVLLIAPTVAADPDPSWLSWGSSSTPSAPAAGLQPATANGSGGASESGLIAHQQGEEWIRSIRKQSQEELAFLEQGRMSLQKYESQSHDCYKEAAYSLQTGCKELTATEEEKQQYAIRLTLCEVATANVNVPVQCLVANPGTSCVEALHQVPQLWTSYSGYRRDVLAMCYAVRHAIERELVEALFYNLTLTQLVNNNLLHAHTRDVAEMHVRELAALANVSLAQDRLVAQSAQAAEITRAVAANVTDLAAGVAGVARTVEAVDRAQEMMMGAVEAWRGQLAGWIDRMAAEAGEARRALDGVASGVGVVQDQVKGVAQAQAEAKRASEALAAWLELFQRATQNQTSHLLGALQNVDSALATHHAQWSAAAADQLAWIHSAQSALVSLTAEHAAQRAAADEWIRGLAAAHATVANRVATLEGELASHASKQRDHLANVTAALAEVRAQSEAVAVGVATARAVLGDRGIAVAVSVMVAAAVRLVGIRGTVAGVVIFAATQAPIGEWAEQVSDAGAVMAKAAAEWWVVAADEQGAGEQEPLADIETKEPAKPLREKKIKWKRWRPTLSDLEGNPIERV
ncbi:hypothetical protein H9P43_008398 [Blastocladiella emersonii ATCC 22665]|nr:hypothetical protein H9P43_008398 [Blastocladiella emersonii ATCC 22665]